MFQPRDCTICCIDGKEKHKRFPQIPMKTVSLLDRFLKGFSKRKLNELRACVAF
jgi:hypothetical protein